ncbi:MAG: hypothetical protein JXR37_09635 [Kiritimatiellae bacterium]|nr:hypothetical protein [Kiritimatiellia bacterium]
MTTNSQERILFSDDFSAYPLTERMDTEYLRGVARESGAKRAGQEQLGPWRQTTLHYSWRSARIKSRRECPLPWRLVERDGQRWLEQPEPFFNVVFMAGDSDWEDYVLELTAAVSDGPVGPIVRYHTSRCNYWLCLEAGHPARLIRRDQNAHIVLGESVGLTLARDRAYDLRVTCDGARIDVAVDGESVISVEDDAWPRGPIALRTEGPGRFANVRVYATESEAARLEARARRRTERQAAGRRSLPAPKLLHEVPLPPDTTVVHMRDVNDDGRLEVVACEVAVPRLDYIRLARMTVVDGSGKTLWTLGESLRGEFGVHGGFAFNTADIDADGRTEILVTRDFEILVIDGASGEVKRRAPTPRAYKGREDHYERTVGDSILVCNLRGLPTAQDLILKDRYRNLWAYTSELEPLWHCHLNTGHYPRARDVNGDGKDEVMAGYTLLAADARPLWTVPGAEPYYNGYPGSEHLDSVLIESFGPAGAPVQIAMAASDLGFVLLDTDGTVRAHHRVGHAQALGAGRFRPDLPGRQFAVRTAWGNFDILNLFDCEGAPLLTREIAAGSVAPVNWLGDGSVLLHFAGCLADGNFEPVVDLPRGGGVHPAACDLNGDGVDELCLRRGDIVQIYGPEQVPASPEPIPPRNLTNWNNYGGFYL